MADKKAEIYFKNTGIKMTCETAEEAFMIYWDMGHHPGFVINGEELKQMGPMESDNPHIAAYWGGYTRDFFKRYFDNEKEMSKAEKDLENLQRIADEKGLRVESENEAEPERE